VENRTFLEDLSSVSAKVPVGPVFAATVPFDPGAEALFMAADFSPFVQIYGYPALPKLYVL
jgi:hypothetical protein